MKVKNHILSKKEMELAKLLLDKIYPVVFFNGIVFNSLTIFNV